MSTAEMRDEYRVLSPAGTVVRQDGTLPRAACHALVEQDLVTLEQQVATITPRLTPLGRDTHTWHTQPEETTP